MRLEVIREMGIIDVSVVYLQARFLAKYNDAKWISTCSSIIVLNDYYLDLIRKGSAIGYVNYGF